MTIKTLRMTIDVPIAPMSENELKRHANSHTHNNRGIISGMVRVAKAPR